jgi:hypothetical protein
MDGADGSTQLNPFHPKDVLMDLHPSIIEAKRLFRIK